MRWVFVLMAAVLMVAGCSGSPPSPTADVEATVEARVSATREADLAARATAESHSEATRTAAPTSTPVPAPTAVPTATPVVMTVYVPIPEPYVSAPGSVEQGVEALYVCLHENDEYRALYVSIIEQSGWDGGSASDFVDSLLADKDLFIQMWLEMAVEDSEGASMLSLLGTMEDELCGDMDLESDGIQDLGMNDAEARAAVEAFYDCLNSDEEVRSFFLSQVEDDGLGREFYSELLSMDRDLFVWLLLAGAKEDPESAEALKELYGAVDVMCP